MKPEVKEALDILELHYDSYFQVKPYADKYKHPHPTDTRGWSQILVSAITGVMGYERKKGPDLADGSDVKGASCWDAIDTPRFNGCIKAGTKADTAGTIKSLDHMPNLYFVLWDSVEDTEQKRCRIWVVRTKHDKLFREVAIKWYKQRADGIIKSDNFQLHPPRNKNINMFKNNCGSLNYPLLFEARLEESNFKLHSYNPSIIHEGFCTKLL